MTRPISNCSLPTKPRFKMRDGVWLCDADGLVGIGETPVQALNDWTMELLDSFEERPPL